MLIRRCCSADPSLRTFFWDWKIPHLDVLLTTNRNIHNTHTTSFSVSNLDQHIFSNSMQIWNVCSFPQWQLVTYRPFATIFWRSLLAKRSNASLWQIQKLRQSFFPILFQYQQNFHSADSFSLDHFHSLEIDKKLNKSKQSKNLFWCRTNNRTIWKVTHTLLSSPLWTPAGRLHQVFVLSSSKLAGAQLEDESFPLTSNETF